ncbi:MAG TPA: glutathione S-transferase [Methylophilaceae bacterium]|nr:glutathione S-transferase [Methylophilaceae bacterium]HAJ72101.1 glutathione S-transferase [Methylophilaceae bacterium]
MTKSKLPILYSYRRCPYAMRARMALKYAGVEVEIREISLRDKPSHMLQVSPKGTVPVLVLQEGTVIEESLEIMQWALQQHDPACWLKADANQVAILIAENDRSFKQALDRYKYPERYPEYSQLEYRNQGEAFLIKLEALLTQNVFLLGASPCLADVAVFPFMRQFAAVDHAWLEASSYVELKRWLRGWINSDLFMSIMEKQPTYIA